MANRYMKKYWTLLTIRELQIQTTMRYHLIPIRWLLWKRQKKKCWWGCGEKGTLVHCWWECKLVQPLWKMVWRLLKKLKVKLPCDLVIPLLDVYPEKMKTLTWKEICIPSSKFIAAIFAIASIGKQHKCPLTNEWIYTKM